MPLVQLLPAAWASRSVKRIRNARRMRRWKLLTYHKNVARMPGKRLATGLDDGLSNDRTHFACRLRYAREIQAAFRTVENQSDNRGKV